MARRKNGNGNGAAAATIDGPVITGPAINVSTLRETGVAPSPAAAAVEIVRSAARESVEIDEKILELFLRSGDLAGLSTAQRVSYYNATCRSLGLNPLTRPFDFISLNGKVVMYAKRDCTDQLRRLYGISIVSLESRKEDGLYIVVAQARDAKGRTDTATGALDIDGLKRADLANAIMKCETKAKRRVTLSICGLGMLDETEIESASTIDVVASAPVQNAPGVVPAAVETDSAARREAALPGPTPARIPTEAEIAAGAKQQSLPVGSSAQAPPSTPSAGSPNVAASDASPKGSGYTPQPDAATLPQRIWAMETFLFGQKDSENRLLRYLPFAVAVPSSLPGEFRFEVNGRWHPAKWNEAMRGVADRAERIKFIEQQLAAEPREKFLAWAEALVKAARGRGVFGK